MPEEIIPNIYRIKIPLPESPLKLLNSYFIRGIRKNLLIDTGFRRPECRKALLDGLRELNADLEKTDIYVTHLHSDHVGLAPELAGKNGTIYISAEDLRWLEFYKGNGWAEFDAQFIKEGFDPEGLEELQYKNPARIYGPGPAGRFVPVSPGQALSYGGYTLRCVGTPGHTPGHMCLYLKEEKLMFLGDHLLFDITPNIISWPGVDNALKTYCGSLKMLKEYDIAIPLPGHRRAGKEVNQRIDELLFHHKARLEEALGVIEREPGLSACQIAGRMTWNIRSRSWETFPIVQKWFAVGEAMAHVDYLLAEGLVCRKTDGSGRRFYHPVSSQKEAAKWKQKNFCAI
ncbi:MAG: MBL fold metallo-hydrolase [Oscillospiraceae bacterium]|nr:MBL fold metallo-hydrolase [Oscillospiraceae bacterium]